MDLRPGRPRCHGGGVEPAVRQAGAGPSGGTGPAPAAGTAPPARRPVAAPRFPDPGRVVRAAPGRAATAGAVVFFCLSLTPSLLPRTALLQGVAGGISAAMGYAVGAAAGWAVARAVRWRPPAPLRCRADVGLGLSGAGLVAFFLWRGAAWQGQVRALMEMPPADAASAVAIVVVAATLAAALVLAARVVRLAARRLDNRLARHVPRPVADALGTLAVAGVVVTLLHGVLWNGFVELANRSFALANGRTTPGVTAPGSATVSGGPGSLVGWDTLGIEGRDFTATGPDATEIAAFTGRPAQDPVRVYVGLDSAAGPRERAALAVRELERTGGFERSVLAVVTTTGTGWVDPLAAEALEFVTNGDSAQVAVQYSYLPSWISVLTDAEKAAEAGRALTEAVLERWHAEPPDRRPMLLVSGTSLGSFGAESAFTGLADLVRRSDGALFTGPTNANPVWRQVVESRRAGDPVPDAPGVAFGTGGVGDEPEPVVPLEVVYLQNGSDPVTFWSPALLFTRPGWLTGERAPDVSPAVRWYPFVTFWQVSGDLAAAWDVPSGHGHRYGSAPVAAWVDLLGPPGWTAADTARLRALIGEEYDPEFTLARRAAAERATG